MKKLCATLLLIFAVWFGWQRYAEHKAKLDRQQRERGEGYERCTSGYAPCDGDATCLKAQTDARQACAKFWFGDAGRTK